MELHKAVEEFQAISAALDRQRKLKVLRRILKLIVIGFFIGKGSDRRISELNERRQLILKNIDRHCTHALELARRRVEKIQNSGTYLIHADKEQCVAAIEAPEADLSYLENNKILEREFAFAKKEELERLRQIILDYNRKFIEQRKRDYRYLWKKGLLSLDEEQQEAIITDDKHNLVVAAAGSGKTEVLITRIAYLKARKPDGVKPSRILAIAYQNKDVKQIEQRLRDRYGIRDVNVRTFHTFRHFKATMEYHKTKDILHVMRILGHKCISNTLIYTHLVDFKDDEYTVKVAHSIEEDKQLIEAGFQYVTDRDNFKIYRKRK